MKKLHQAGDIVVCANSHPCYELIRTVHCGDTIEAKQFRRLDDRMPDSRAGAKIPPCWCGALLTKSHVSDGIIFHMQDGFSGWYHGRIALTHGQRNQLREQRPDEFDEIRQ